MASLTSHNVLSKKIRSFQKLQDRNYETQALQWEDKVCKKSRNMCTIKCWILFNVSLLAQVSTKEDSLNLPDFLPYLLNNVAFNEMCSLACTCCFGGNRTQIQKAFFLLENPT